jgi:hypothetical protein
MELHSNDEVWLNLHNIVFSVRKSSLLEEEWVCRDVLRCIQWAFEGCGFLFCGNRFTSDVTFHRDTVMRIFSKRFIVESIPVCYTVGEAVRTCSKRPTP